MNIRKRIIEDVQLRGKRVIIRADYNVPLDDSLQITDDTRIRSTLPTINRAVDEGAKVILCSHLGRPKGRFDPKFSLAPVAKRLQRLLGFGLGAFDAKLFKAVRDLDLQRRLDGADVLVQRAAQVRHGGVVGGGEGVGENQGRSGR